MKPSAGNLKCGMASEPPDGWDQLMQRTIPEYGFLRSIWYSAWANSYLPYGNWSGPIMFLSVGTPDGCSAVLPLATQKMAFLRFVSLAGPYMPFRDLPIDVEEPCIAGLLADSVTGLRNLVGLRLGPVDQRSPSALALVNALCRRGWKVSHHEVGRQFVVKLPSDLKKYIASLGKKKIKRINYYWRKMQQAGPCELICHSELNEADWYQVFGEVADVEGRSWVGDLGEARFVGEQNQTFWRTLASDPWIQQSLKVWMIYFDGHPVSFCLALDAGQTRYIIANSYDPKVADFSTGSTLYKEVITQAITAGLTEVHIGQGDSGYKNRWRAKDVGGLMDIVAFPPGVAGVLLGFVFEFSKKMGL